MIYFVEIGNANQILSYSQAPYSTITEMPWYDPERFKTIEELPSPLPEASYWESGKLVIAPPKPGDAYKFNYTTKQWVLDTALAWIHVRFQRDKHLQDCDWVTLRAQEQGTPVPIEWASYRQALRDITLQPDPTNIIWPEKPTT